MLIQRTPLVKPINEVRSGFNSTTKQETPSYHIEFTKQSKEISKTFAEILKEAMEDK